MGKVLKEKGTEDEMAGWNHRLDGCEFEWTPGVGDGQGDLASAIHGVAESDMTEWLNWTKWWKHVLYTLVFISPHTQAWGFPGRSDSKESTCHVGDLGSIPGSGGSLEGGMAPHSSILAWKIPWTEEPGRLQSIVSQRTQLKQLSTHAKLVQRWDAPWLKNTDTPVNVPLPSGSVA